MRQRIQAVPYIDIEKRSLADTDVTAYGQTEAEKNKVSSQKGSLILICIGACIGVQGSPLFGGQSLQ